ncbi:hypothetical protein [Draconibacterium orientale]|jgi:DNA-binding MarR family transcriptional regulator|uniref:hypothetical protein n=1 Tax=Draconibacterium orientale TaxID=1168034 RepID=UPI002A0A43A0|nr:hypothetical protein [Draconibacterium orientale]
MSRKTIDIQEISNQFEKDILKLLEEKEEYVYGDIIKDLKLSARKGQVLISSLISKGLVKRVDQTSYLKLNVEIN